MAEFTADLQSFRVSFPVSDIDPNMEIANQYAGLNPSVLTTSDMDFQCLMPFSSDNFFSHHQAPEFTGNLAENFPWTLHHLNQNEVPVAQPMNVSAGNELHDSKKRKAMDKPDSSSGTSSPQVSETGIKRKNVMIYYFLTCYIVPHEGTCIICTLELNLASWLFGFVFVFRVQEEGRE